MSLTLAERMQALKEAATKPYKNPNSHCVVFHMADKQQLNIDTKPVQAGSVQAGSVHTEPVKTGPKKLNPALIAIAKKCVEGKISQSFTMNASLVMNGSNVTATCSMVSNTLSPEKLAKKANLEALLAKHLHPPGNDELKFSFKITAGGKPPPLSSCSDNDDIPVPPPAPPMDSVCGCSDHDCALEKEKLLQEIAELKQSLHKPTA